MAEAAIKRRVCADGTVATAPLLQLAAGGRGRCVFTGVRRAAVLQWPRFLVFYWRGWRKGTEQHHSRHYSLKMQAGLPGVAGWRFLQDASICHRARMCVRRVGERAHSRNFTCPPYRQTAGGCGHVGKQQRYFPGGREGQNLGRRRPFCEDHFLEAQLALDVLERVFQDLHTRCHTNGSTPPLPPHPAHANSMSR